MEGTPYQSAMSMLNFTSTDWKDRKSKTETNI